MTQRSYLDAVAERVVVFDGAFGTYIQDLELGPDDFGGPALEGCNEMLCLTRPDAIRDMHRAFYDVGVDVVETASFGSFSVVLNEYGVADKAHELNVAAGRLAREVADELIAADGRERWVAGSIGPGTKLPSLGHIGFAALRDAYEEQAAGLLEGGVDLFLIETCYDLLQAKAAMIACRRAMRAAGAQRPTAGAGVDGDDRADVARQRDRGRPGVRSRPWAPTSSASTAPPARPRCRSTCATCRSTRRCPSRCSPTPACRASSTAAPTTT